MPPRANDNRSALHPIRRIPTVEGLELDVLNRCAEVRDHLNYILAGFIEGRAAELDQLVITLSRAAAHARIVEWERRLPNVP